MIYFIVLSKNLLVSNILLQSRFLMHKHSREISHLSLAISMQIIMRAKKKRHEKEEEEREMAKMRSKHVI